MKEGKAIHPPLNIPARRKRHSTDTAYSYGDFMVLPVNAEYLIKIPSVGKVFSFSNYEVNQRECGCEHQKMDVLSSFTMNGDVVQAVLSNCQDKVLL